MVIRKRFIAGAKCPECGGLDKLVLYRLDEKMYRECVACDFREEMRHETSFRELETRVNRSAIEKASETGVVRIIDMGHGKNTANK